MHTTPHHACTCGRSQSVPVQYVRDVLGNVIVLHRAATIDHPLPPMPQPGEDNDPLTISDGAFDLCLGLIVVGMLLGEAARLLGLV